MSCEVIGETCACLGLWVVGNLDHGRRKALRDGSGGVVGGSCEVDALRRLATALCDYESGFGARYGAALSPNWFVYLR